MLQPQIILFLDETGSIRAEAPGKNGAREKITLDPDWRSRNPELVAAFEILREAIRREIERQTLETRRKNISYVAQTHRPFGKDGEMFIDQIWPNAERQFAARVKRHYNGSAGNLSNDKKSSINLKNLL